MRFTYYLNTQFIDFLDKFLAKLNLDRSKFFRASVDFMIHSNTKMITCDPAESPSEKSRVVIYYDHETEMQIMYLKGLFFDTFNETDILYSCARSHMIALLEFYEDNGYKFDEEEF